MDPNKKPTPTVPTRLTVSGGKKTTPFVAMAHPIEHRHAWREWLLVAVLILVVIVIALAGSSR
jgi:hypothetical protein